MPFMKPVVDRRHEGVFLWSLYIIPCWEGGAPQGPLATNLAYEIPGITEEEEGDFILYRLWQPVEKTTTGFRRPPLVLMQLSRVMPFHCKYMMVHSPSPSLLTPKVCLNKTIGVSANHGGFQTTVVVLLPQVQQRL